MMGMRELVVTVSSRRELGLSPSHSLYLSISPFLLLRLPLFSRSTCLSLSSSYALYFHIILTHLFLSLSLTFFFFAFFFFHSMKTSSDRVDVISILYAMRINKYSCGRVTIMQTDKSSSHDRKFTTFHNVSLKIRNFILEFAYYFPHWFPSSTLRET